MKPFNLIRRLELINLASQEMREKVSNQLLPQLKSFAPDILFISAGFDAHFDDLYHFLNENDFHWLTSELCNIVQLNGGKVISVWFLNTFDVNFNFVYFADYGFSLKYVKN